MGRMLRKVFQIATGHETKIIDLARMVKKIVLKEKEAASEIIFTDPRKGEIRKNYSDIARAKGELGYKPQVTLKKSN